MHLPFSLDIRIALGWLPVFFPTLDRPGQLVLELLKMHLTIRSAAVHNIGIA